MKELCVSAQPASVCCEEGQVSIYIVAEDIGNQVSTDHQMYGFDLVFRQPVGTLGRITLSLEKRVTLTVLLQRSQVCGATESPAVSGWADWAR